MDYLHPVMSAALGPFMPSKRTLRVADGSALNDDDDVYLVDVLSNVVVRRIGRSSEYRAFTNPTVPVGYAALTGLQCKSFLG